ncbi:MAG: hypothetical protein ACJLS2_02460 [Microcella pacifica]
MGQTLNSNGHRRRQLVKRVKAEEKVCALCGAELDYSLTMEWGKHSKRCQSADCAGCVPHPRRVEVDEDIPRSRGGSQYDRRNTHAMERACNQYKGSMTLEEARAKLAGRPVTRPPRPPITASPIW